MLDPSPWQALGAALAAARHQSGLTQHALARQLGITQAAYSQFEQGWIRPRPARLGQLAVILHADVTRLADLAGYPLAQVLAVPTASCAPHTPPTRDRLRVRRP